MLPFCPKRHLLYLIKRCVLILSLMCALFLVARYFFLSEPSVFFFIRHGMVPAQRAMAAAGTNAFDAHFRNKFRYQDHSNNNNNNNSNNNGDKSYHERFMQSIPRLLYHYKYPDLNFSQNYYNATSSLTSRTPPLLLQQRLLRSPKEWPEFFLPRSERQFSLEYSYLHEAATACSGSEVKVLVMTLSLPGNRAQRDAIRRTWGSLVRTGAWPNGSGYARSRRRASTARVAQVFLVGEGGEFRRPGLNVSQDVKAESAEYGDVVQWKGLEDTYFNLTMKVLLGLKWAVRHCPRLSHVIKTDDDTFVHVPRLLRLLADNDDVDSNPGPTTNKTIRGPFYYASYVERRGKYRVSLDAYPFSLYGPHVKGNLYVISGDLVPRLVSLAAFLPYNNMEDVHVTGTLARTLGCWVVGFSKKEFSAKDEAPDLCLFRDNALAVGAQRVSPELHFQFWKVLSGTLSCTVQND